ncbi:MAG: tyrosine--tRNA ligase [Alphaproteobacteria bacterium]|nr:tyrosine--tRNA ligase [Alphaproteobacteria bacterium]
MAKSEFLNVLEARGFIHQCTDMEGLDALFVNEKPVAAYIGFDCTAPSLHAGSLMQIMLLRWLQKCGHKPIVLMGGGTTKVGDPSGKDESRKLLSDDQIQQNMDGIKKVFSQYLKFGDGPTDAIMVNNDDWLKNINYIEFLRDYGKHFSVNRMMSMDSVKLRLEREQHLSFLEFNYMILQAYDFVELNKRYNCRLQFGGSDQWGNIINGTELYRHLNPREIISSGFTKTKEQASEIVKQKQRDYSLKHDVFGLTTPLLTTASGAKMGKSADGAVWLDAEMLSPYDYWQYWRNADDRDVGKFLRLFTELSLDEIAKLEALKDSQINDAKKILANEVTALCHGKDAAQKAADTAQKTFEQGQLGDDLPTIEIPRKELEAGIPAFDLLKRASLAESGGEARRLITGGGAKLNDEKIVDANQPISLTHANSNGVIKLSAGKKRHVLVKVV